MLHIYLCKIIIISVLMLIFLTYKNILSINNILYIFVISCILSAFLGLFQKFILLQKFPFHIYVNKIPSAHIMITLTLISLVVCIESLKQNKFLAILSLFAFIIGIYVTFLTETRGVFLGMPAVAIYLSFRYLKYLKNIKILFSVIILVSLFTYLFSISSIADRFKQGIEVFSSKKETIFCEPHKTKEHSVALRIGYWKFAIDEIYEKPVLGHGNARFLPLVRKKLGTTCPSFKKDISAYHPHNDFLNTLFSYGIFGFVFMLSIIFYPLCCFIKANQKDNKSSIICNIGVITILETIFCQLTNTPFWHKETLIMYLFFIMLCFSKIYRNQEIKNG